MPFPLSYTKTRRLPVDWDYKLFRSDLKNALKEKLADGGMHKIIDEHDEIRFSGPMFRFIWNGFTYVNGITSAEIRFNKGNRYVSIKQKLRFTEAFVLALFFTLLPGIFFFILPVYAIIMLLIIWGILFTGNYILAFSLFNRFIKKTINRTIKNLENKDVYG